MTAPRRTQRSSGATCSKKKSSDEHFGGLDDAEREPREDRPRVHHAGNTGAFTVGHLGRLDRALDQLFARVHPLLEREAVTLDLDASYVERHGPVGSRQGTRGVYTGKVAWQPLLCFVGETGEWLHARLRHGHWHRAKASVENRIKEAKPGFALDNLPCRLFHANWAYLPCTLLAYNLLRWLKLLALPASERNSNSKRLRFRFPNIAATVGRSGRRLVLRLSAGYPLFADFASALERVRTLARTRLAEMNNVAGANS